MPDFEKMPPEQIKEVKLYEAEMLKGGAEVDENGRIIVTAKQEEGAAAEMRREMLGRDLHKYFTHLDMIEVLEPMRKVIDQSKQYEKDHGKEAMDRLQKIYADLYGASNAIDKIEKNEAKE